MADIIEKYQNANKDTTLEVRQALASFHPKGALKDLKLGEAAEQNRKILEQAGVAQACIDSVNDSAEQANWTLTMLYDMLREDSSTFSIFENKRVNDKSLRQFLGNAGTKEYGADKAAWVLSAAMGHVPTSYDSSEVQSFLAKVIGDNAAPCSKLGALEAVTNLLKADEFRKMVWAHPGVAECVFKVDPNADSQQHVYRFVFGIWMLSFDAELTADLKSHDVIQKMKAICVSSRTEKVIRLSLTVLKNLLGSKTISEEIAEGGLLEAVQQLEYEKWRDADLYEEIRDTSQLIALKVQEISNFERYEKELQTGKLQWGFIHSAKFWTENVNKFETNDFRAIKHLAELLNDFRTDKTTLAVCCHDIGQFVTLHPLGKRKIANLHIKERIMKLMSSTDAADREVRREALLCCQKMMLNKWQDIETSK